MVNKYISMIELKRLLDEKADLYNNPSFIANDPISIPHCFTDKYDKEIMGFFFIHSCMGPEKDNYK